MKRAIAYIYLKRYGKRNDLIKLFDEKFVDELALQGYIAQGTSFKESDKSYIRTWRKTEMANEYFRVFIKPTIEEESGYRKAV